MISHLKIENHNTKEQS
uniref:Uncharacterized protein n=1 Tax=Rhizophora mucronata TaxID=61149 RepID=A0A2P2PVR8_RHIMU